MKIIEALKKIKDLARKATDIKERIRNYCTDMDYENPVYPDQKAQVSEWLQSYKDLVREIGRIKYCIQKTNVMTKVTITLDNNDVSKSITEWIERRKNLAGMEKEAWSALTNRGLKDVRLQQSQGQIVEAKVRYYFDPKHRDKMLDVLSSEPSLIDSKLEIINAITDLIEE
jgi:hypothetical protein